MMAALGSIFQVVNYLLDTTLIAFHMALFDLQKVIYLERMFKHHQETT